MKKFVVLALLVIVLGAGYGVYRSLNPPRVGGIPFEQLGPEEQTRRRAAAHALEDRIGDVARATRQRQHKPFQLTATEDQLNTLLQDRLKTRNLPVSNLRIGLEKDRIALQGDAKYQGLSAPATLYGTLEPYQGGVRLQVQSLTIGGFPAPEKWKGKIESAVTENLDKFFRGEHDAKIDAVTMEPGQLTVSGTTG